MPKGPVRRNVRHWQVRCPPDARRAGSPRRGHRHRPMEPLGHPAGRLTRLDLARGRHHGPAGQPPARPPVRRRLQDQPGKALLPVRPHRPAQRARRRPAGQDRGTDQQPVRQTPRRTSPDPAAPRRGRTTAARDRDHRDQRHRTTIPGSPATRRSSAINSRLSVLRLPASTSPRKSPPINSRSPGVTLA